MAKDCRNVSRLRPRQSRSRGWESWIPANSRARSVTTRSRPRTTERFGSERRFAYVREQTDGVEAEVTVSKLEREVREQAQTAWLMAPNEPEVAQGVAFFLRRPEWQLHASCRGADTALFLSGRGRSASSAAIAVCADCLVRDECLEYAMSDNEIVGVWGGTTTEERRRIRRNA